MTELRIRQAVRALLVTPDQSVLLVRFEFRDGHGVGDCRAAAWSRARTTSRRCAGS